jgi:glycine cleavage system H protein
MNIPDDLRYSTEHEWVRVDGSRARVGITDYAQDALGDIVYVELPAVDAAVETGGPLGEVESTKSVSEIYAPVAGTVTAINESLSANPERIRTPMGTAGSASWSWPTWPRWTGSSTPGDTGI